MLLYPYRFRHLRSLVCVQCYVTVCFSYVIHFGEMLSFFIMTYGQFLYLLLNLPDCLLLLIMTKQTTNDSLLPVGKHM